eukprot:6183147-Pleurochrysis_carterae.AAC.3
MAMKFEPAAISASSFQHLISRLMIHSFCPMRICMAQATQEQMLQASSRVTSDVMDNDNVNDASCFSFASTSKSMQCRLTFQKHPAAMMICAALASA